MRLTFMGTTSTDGGCPALYVTDRGTYVVQGDRVTDFEALNDLKDVLPHETFVEIPHALLTLAATHAVGTPSPDAKLTGAG